MAAQIEIKLSRMSDTDVDRRSGRYVTTLPALFLLVGAEQPRVVSFLHNDEGDAWLVIGLEFYARLSDRRQLVLQQLQKLALGHAVPVQDYPMGFIAAR